MKDRSRIITHWIMQPRSDSTSDISPFAQLKASTVSITDFAWRVISMRGCPKIQVNSVMLEAIDGRSSVGCRATVDV